jgi:hypothetical protein
VNALLAAILSNTTVLAILGGIILAIGALFKGRSDGAAKERAKQTKAETKARDVADEIDNDLGTLTPDQRRKELERWGR